MAGVSGIFPTRWGYAAAASTVDLNHVSQAVEPDDLWVHSGAHWWWCMFVMLLLGLVSLAVAAGGVFRRPRFG